MDVYFLTVKKNHPVCMLRVSSLRWAVAPERGGEILAPSRARATICRIKFLRGGFSGLHVAGASLRHFGPRRAPIREQVLMAENDILPGNKKFAVRNRLIGGLLHQTI